MSHAKEGGGHKEEKTPTKWFSVSRTGARNETCKLLHIWGKVQEKMKFESEQSGVQRAAIEKESRESLDKT